jgi:hypothetical protein
MNPAKCAALLNGKVQKFEKGVGGLIFTTEDAALAIAGVRERPVRLIGRIKYAGQHEFAGQLVFELMRAVRSYARRDGWRMPDDLGLYAVCQLAVHEAVTPRLCGYCKGRGQTLALHGARGRPRFAPKPLKVDCPKCAGEGVLIWRHYGRWKRTGINRKRWMLRWAGLFDKAVAPILADWENDFFRVVRKRLT